MLNKTTHLLVMKQILERIYKNASLAPLLGFKGGSAAMMFYGLNRFSVDLDFDLLADDDNQQLWDTVRTKIKTIIETLGVVKESRVKRYTIFSLLSYGDTDHNVKVEISKRKPAFLTKKHFELKDHLGLSVQVATPAYLFASKLVALTNRKNFANRDVFDVYFYCSKRWNIDEFIIQSLTEKTVKEYLSECIRVVESVNERQVLAGLGELLENEKQKAWVKEHLKEKTLFLLKSYKSALT